MVYLSENLFIGQGAHRNCYIHSEDKDLCVKIPKSGHLKEMRREQKYYEKLEHRRISWEMIPKFHGTIDTNLGEGAVFDLVRDFDGEVSKDLAYYFNLEQDENIKVSGLKDAILNLREYVHEEKILTMALKERNILFKRESLISGRLVIVDDIGNTEFIPISNIFSFFAHKKIDRKILRFRKKLIKKFPFSRTLIEVNEIAENKGNN